jgi:hypothetical protein
MLLYLCMECISMSARGGNFYAMREPGTKCKSRTADFHLLSSAYLRVNFSIRPAVSTIRCTPVKKGWQLEHTSIRRSLRVEPVANVLPQPQVTVT